MELRKSLRLVTVVILSIHVASSQNKTSKEWAGSAQKTIWEISQIFHRASIGLGGFSSETKPTLVALSKKAANIAGVFGVFGALFSIIMTFLPGSESPELKMMRSEFNKLSQKMDEISRSLDDTKDLIKLATKRSAYIEHESKIHTGFSQLKTCLDSLANVKCTGVGPCKRKKAEMAQRYIASMDVQVSVNMILRGVTSDTVFGKQMLYLLKEESKCNVPKINFFSNKVTALVAKGLAVTLFYNQLTKIDFNIMDGTVLADNMLRLLENKRQAMQHQCIEEIDYWMPLDIENSNEHFSSDIQASNTKVIRILNAKYPWIDWRVVTYKGSIAPQTGPIGSSRSLLYSSSKAHNVHTFVVPTNMAEVRNLQAKKTKWKQVVEAIGSDFEKGVALIQNQIQVHLTLKNQIQSFAILPGEQWILGHYTTEIKQVTLGVNDISTANVFVTKLHNYVVVVSFVQAEYPPPCSEPCSGKGTCFLYPYSTKMGCKCNPGYSGETCNASVTVLKLKSVINLILQQTMKLPTFVTIQHAIEDTQLLLKTSTESIQTSITKLGERIDEQFKNLGEFMSTKFEWFATLSKYKDAIENLNYFHNISSVKLSDFRKNSTITSFKSKNNSNADLNFNAEGSPKSEAEDKDVANFLLSPTGIRKWLYQINFLIIGRRDSQFNAHKALLFLVMDTHKNRLCSKSYKDDVTRTYRQLMLLQLQGYMLWSNAYSIVNRDGSFISNSYTSVLKNQQMYMKSAACSVTIPHSTNLHDCTGGYYIHRSMNVKVTCGNGYFTKGELILLTLTLNSLTRKRSNMTQSYDNNIFIRECIKSKVTTQKLSK